ncbi:AMP-binding protein, partial [Streptomyces rubiginosohelvolus]
MTAFSIPARFAEQVARTPHATAVSEAATGTALSYQELDQRANRLARRLIALGVGREDPVGVLMTRSSDLVVALLAILKAGGVYVPVHEDDPADRRQWIVDRARPVLLLVDEAMHRAGVPDRVPVLAVRDPETAGASAEDPQVPVRPEQLAYVIHTSGSTGRPKGVAVTQRDVVRLLVDPQWSPERHARVLQLAPYAFDVSAYEIWMPLLHGGQVVVPPPGRLEPSVLRELIEKYEITGLLMT